MVVVVFFADLYPGSTANERQDWQRRRASMHQAAAAGAIKGAKPGDEPREAGVAKWHGAAEAAGTAQRRVDVRVQRANPTKVLVKNNS